MCSVSVREMADSSSGIERGAEEVEAEAEAADALLSSALRLPPEEAEAAELVEAEAEAEAVVVCFSSSTASKPGCNRQKRRRGMYGVKNEGMAVTTALIVVSKVCCRNAREEVGAAVPLDCTAQHNTAQHSTAQHTETERKHISK